MSNTEKILYAVLAALVWLYIALRAYFVPITIDEAATFLHFIQTGSIWPGEDTIWDANNHVLNSFLSRCFYLLFGSSEFALRLHAVLIMGIYLLYTYLFAKLIKSPVVRWAFIAAFIFPHFLLEFFAYTRGYGISMAFLLGAFYHMAIFFKETKPLHLIGVLVFMCLATLSNLTLFILLLLITALIVVKYIYLIITEKKGIVPLVVSLLMVAFPAYWFAWFGLQMKERGSLYYGNQDGFWETTIGTLMNNFTWENNTIGKVILVVLFLGLLVLLINYLRKERLVNWFSHGVLFSSLLLGNIAANFAMNWLLGTNFLEDRTGLFYYPLFILALCFMLDESNISFLKQAAYVLLVVMLFFPVNFLMRMNLTHSTLWDHDAGMKKFFSILKEDANPEEQLPTVSSYHLRAMIFSYYNFIDGGHFNQIANIINTGGEVDYQIVTKEQCNECDLFEELAYDPISKQYLMRRKQFLERQHVFSSANITTNGIVSNEFFEFERIKIDTLVGEVLQLEFDLTINAVKNPFHAWMMIDVLDEEENLLNNNMVGMNWLKPAYKGEDGNFHYTVLLSKIPEDAKAVKTFIWNLQKKEFEVVKGEIRINKLVEP